jgi:excisionase family DNA binding protein
MSIELRREDENISDISTWISQSEAARLRGVSREAIYNLVKKNRLKTLRLGEKTLVNRIEVENYRPRLPGPKPKKKSVTKQNSLPSRGDAHLRRKKVKTRVSHPDSALSTCEMQNQMTETLRILFLNRKPPEFVALPGSPSQT